MDQQTKPGYFEEEQRFPWWIKAFALLTLGLVGLPVVLAWITGAPPALTVAVAVPAAFFLALTVLTFAMRLSTRLDSDHLHLRIHPIRWCLMPRRMAKKDIALRDISRSHVATYNAFTDMGFWGWHFWGLSVSRAGRYLYVMRPNSPVTGRGVRLELNNGDILLVGSTKLDQLADALARATGQKS